VTKEAVAMTDNDLFAMLHRAMRLVIILGIVLAIVFTIKAGWQSGLLALVGAGISFTGIREWRTLSLTLFAHMDDRPAARPMGRTVVMFLLRLCLVGAVLYVSLRCLHGTIYALVAGIALSVLALSFEALRHLRG
jgi:hypothetical protein